MGLPFEDRKDRMEFLERQAAHSEPSSSQDYSGAKMVTSEYLPCQDTAGSLGGREHLLLERLQPAAMDLLGSTPMQNQGGQFKMVVLGRAGKKKPPW